MTTTYRAVEVSRPGELELVERELRPPGPGQVRVRVEACGICHTDALTVAGQFPGLSLPRVPGHEVVGRIDALGDGVEQWKVGQRVGVGFIGGVCLRCDSCRRGDFVNCTNQALPGINYDGGYADVIVTPAVGLVSVPDSLQPAEAAPLLCAGVTTYNALRNSGARAGDLVAVLGVGGLGHLGVQFARQMGFRVAAIARGADKEPLARQLGAHHYLDSQAVDAAAELQKLGGARVILATVSSPKAMSPLVAGLGRRGKMIVAGAGAEPLEVSTTQLIFGMHSIEGTVTGSATDMEDTLAFSVLQQVRALIETVPLERAVAGYQKMVSGQARFRMVIVTGQ